MEITVPDIKDWEGEPMNTLGRVLHSGYVEILGDDQLRVNRFLMAFPEAIVILKVELLLLNPFSYERKLPMAGLKVRKMEPTEGHSFAFEISSNDIQPFAVICHSVDSLNQWLQVFSNNTVRNLTTRLSNLTLPGSIPVDSSHLQASSSSDSSLKDLPTRQKHGTERSKPYGLSMTQEVLRQIEVNKRRNARMPMSDSVPSYSSTNRPSPSASSRSTSIQIDLLNYVEGAAERFKAQFIRNRIAMMKSGMPNSLEGVENVTHTGENSNRTQNHQPHQSSEPNGLRSQSQLWGPSGMSSSMHDNLMTRGTIQEMPDPTSNMIRSSRQELLQLMEESEQNSSEGKQKMPYRYMRALRRQQQIEKSTREAQQKIIKLMEEQIIRNSGTSDSIVDIMVARLESRVRPNPPESTQPAPEPTQPAPESAACPTHTQTSLQMLDSSQRQQQLVEVVKSQHIAPSHPDI